MSGQHTRDGEGHQAKDSMKKQTGAAEHPQEGSGVAPQANTAQEEHGKPTSQQEREERADEASH